MKTRTMKHHRPEKKVCYPVNMDLLAHYLEQHGIDIAPTRMTWLNLAQCIANQEGEQGREAFHRIAAVWPDYSRHDSELCYNRALRQTGRPPGINYLVKVCRRHGINLLAPRYRKQGRPVTVNNNHHQQKKETRTMKTVKPIQQEMLEATLPSGRDILGRSPLTDLLMNIFPRQQVIEAIEQYLVGFESFDTGRIDGSILFWQVDNQGNIHNGKRIYYKANGHRDKKVPPIIVWPHSQQCLFGLHRYSQENRHKTVAIVESEKSALIMSIVNPQYLWMACGSMNNFNERFLEPVKDATIIACPDVDYRRDRMSGKSISFALWQRAARKMNRHGWNIQMSTSLEDMATTPQRLDKIDIADVAIADALKQHVKRLMRQ